MNIVTTTSVFPIGTDHFHIVDRLAKIGYTALDMAFDYCELGDAGFMSDGYESWALQLREHAETQGLRFTHSHASFDADAEGDIVVRNLRCAEILGIPYMVVHPVFRRPDGSIYEDAEAYLEVNRKHYASLLEKAERHGVILLCENLLWGASIPPEVQSELVSRVDSPYFGWCYDTGHAHRCGLHQTELLGLSHPPLSLHVQDNQGQHDEHLLPGDGTVDWKEFLDTLHAVGYTGDLVLEAHHQSIDAPDDARDAILADLLNRAQKMRSYYEHL